jgi:hypothetical protein
MYPCGGQAELRPPPPRPHRIHDAEARICRIRRVGVFPSPTRPIVTTPAPKSGRRRCFASAVSCLRRKTPRVLGQFGASKSPPQTRAGHAPGRISRVHPRSTRPVDGSPPRTAAWGAVAGRQRCWSGEKTVGSRQMARARRTAASPAGHVQCCGSATRSVCIVTLPVRGNMSGEATPHAHGAQMRGAMPRQGVKRQGRFTQN